MADIEGKVVVVTGASSGIGAALAELVAKRGAKVVLVARHEERLRVATENCAPNGYAVVADVTRRHDVKRIVREAVAHFGHVDVWVNNAGRGITRMPSELTDDDVDTMVRDNVKSALYGMQEILPHFIERGSGQIINISSMLGRIPFATFRSAYSGSKHFLNALTAMFRAEVRGKYPGIQVSLVSPGIVATDFGKNALYGGPDSRSLPGVQSVEEVAEVIAGAIESRRNDTYTNPHSHEQVIKYYSAEDIS
jgi:NADP-dependent 3-hydroxy acid dehydrogenase YdfG